MPPNRCMMLASVTIGGVRGLYTIMEGSSCAVPRDNLGVFDLSPLRCSLGAIR